ncbi:hypothetical protein [Actinomadura sp. 3N508]|uniref:hypothetical protein n=1 Tax=Actinomadura sp. 3N508 TaxID=3375153 RepID=UPI00378AD2D3
MPHRLRRLGSASAAVTAGALVLLLPASAADASGRAGTGTAETCKKGTDPASTIENWACNLGNLREAILPSSPDPKPEPAPPKTPDKPAEPAKPAPGSGGKGAEPPAKAPRKAPSAPGGEVPFGPFGPSGPSGSAGFAPYAAGPPSDPALPPGALPVPELATGPGAQAPRVTAAQPQTRLVSPVAASGDDSGQMLWVAAAAGAAGAVAALNLNVAARTLRRRRAAG